LILFEKIDIARIYHTNLLTFCDICAHICNVTKSPEMTLEERNQIRTLIPDLQPMDHVTLNTKRINFIYGQGIVVYNEYYAVEIYVPKNKNEHMTFFAVDRHFGNTDKLGEYYRRIPVMSYDHTDVNSQIKEQFDEAIFLNELDNGASVQEMYGSGNMLKVA